MTAELSHMVSQMFTCFLETQQDLKYPKRAESSGTREKDKGIAGSFRLLESS